VSKPSQVIVLAEDARQQQLARRYLQRLGVDSHAIRNVALPSSRGCGEQWVRKRYPQEVKSYRGRSKRAKSALIIAIDADTGEVAQRVRQLGTALAEAELDARGDGETIVHLVPKRNVETWILCLNGRQVDEDTDYSRQTEVARMIEPAAIAFFAWARPNATMPSHCVPSLSAAIPEIRRLE